MGNRSFHGNCNICGKYGQLTKDHVPPKGSVRITQMISLDMIEAMGMDQPIKKPKNRIHQNGVTFPTLCSDCNNKLLGSQLDREFNSFSASIYNIIYSSIHLPNTLNINCNPSKVVRAFLGHIAAVGSFDNSKLIREELGDFIQGKGELPNDAMVYCWPFPYKNQALLTLYSIAPDMAKYGFNGVLITWVMKFAPVAFMLVWRKPDTINLRNLTCISDYVRNDKEQEVALKLAHIHQHWPEAPRSNDVIMINREMTSIKSFPYTSKRKK